MFTYVYVFLCIRLAFRLFCDLFVCWRNEVIDFAQNYGMCLRVPAKWKRIIGNRQTHTHIHIYCIYAWFTYTQTIVHLPLVPSQPPIWLMLDPSNCVLPTNLLSWWTICGSHYSYLLVICFAFTWVIGLLLCTVVVFVLRIKNVKQL